MSYKPVDTAITMIVGPCIDDSDFKTLEEAIAYNAAGMDISLIVEKTDGTTSVTVITLTTGGTSDWTHKDGGYYEVEITAAQNIEEGIAYLRGVCTGVLPFESQRYNIVIANVYDSWIKGTDALYVDTVQLNGGSQSLVDLKDLVDNGYNTTSHKINGVILADVCTTNTDMVGTDNAALATTALTNVTWTNAKAVFLNASIQTIDTVVDGIQTDLNNSTDGLGALKTLIDTNQTDLDTIIVDTGTDIPARFDGIEGTTFATATDSLEAIRNRGDDAWVTGAGGSSPTVEEIRSEMDTNSSRLSAIEADTTGIGGAAMRGTEGANTIVPDAAGVAPTAIEIRQEMDANSTKMAPSQTLADYKATGFSTHSVTDVWSSITRSLTDKSEFSLSTIGIKGIWDQATSVLTTIGSVGKLIVDNINATISSRSPSSEYDTEMARIDTTISSRNAIAPNTVIPDVAGIAATLHGITDGKIDVVDGIVDAIRNKTDNLPSGISKGEALPKFDFLMVLSSNHVAAAIDKIVTGEISKDGGTFTGITNTITEVSSGMYTIADGFTSAEMDANIVTLKFDANDCDTRIISIITT